MRKLRIGVIDLVTKGPTRALYARVMNANLDSIMPQVVGCFLPETGGGVQLFTGLGPSEGTGQISISQRNRVIGGSMAKKAPAFAGVNTYRTRSEALAPDA